MNILLVGAIGLYHACSPRLKEYADHSVNKNMARMAYAAVIPSVITNRIALAGRCLLDVAEVCLTLGNNCSNNARAINSISLITDTFLNGLYLLTLRAINPNVKVDSTTSFLTSQLIDRANTCFAKLDTQSQSSWITRHVTRRAAYALFGVAVLGSCLASGVMGGIAAIVSLCTAGAFPKLNSFAYQELRDTVKLGALIFAGIKVINPDAHLGLEYDHDLHVKPVA